MTEFTRTSAEDRIGFDRFGEGRASPPPPAPDTRVRRM